MATAPIIATSDRAPGLGIVVVNYRTPALTIECLAALACDRDKFGAFRVIVVDGASGDGSAEQIAAAVDANGWDDWASLAALPVNGGFAYANNRGISLLCDGASIPELICLINPDARVLGGALASLSRLLAAEPRAGAAGALLVHEDGRPQGSAFPWPTIRGEFARATHTRAVERLVRAPAIRVDTIRAQRVDWVTGAAVMFKTAALRDAGLFDDGFFLYFEETELMRRLADKGWSIWHEPAARVVHHAGAATNLRDPATGRSLRKPMPRYWYEARRRYFTLTRGKAHTILAGMAFLAGRVIWQARCLLTGREDEEAPRTTRDFIAHSLWPQRSDTVSHAVRLGDPQTAEPAWMRRS